MARKPPLVNVKSQGCFVGTVPTIDFRDGVSVRRSTTELAVIVSMSADAQGFCEDDAARNQQFGPAVGGAVGGGSASPFASYLFGGATSNVGDVIVGTIQKFDPVTQIWTEAGALLTPRSLASVIRLRNGKYLVFGGYTQLGSVLTPAYNVELYDPATETCSSAFTTTSVGYTIPAAGPASKTFVAAEQPGPMFQTSGGRVAMDCTMNPDGPLATRKVLRQVPGPFPGLGEYVVTPTFGTGGGTTVTFYNGVGADLGPVGISFIYQNVLGGVVQPIGPNAPGPMAFLVGEAGGVLLDDGRVAVLGGDPGEGPGAATTAVQAYDPTTGAWYLQANLNQSRTSYNQSVVLLPNGKVLVSGGSQTSKKSGTYTVFDIRQTQEIWDPASNTCSYAAPLPTKLVDQGLSRLPDGTILIAGGVGPNADLSSTANCWIYDPLLDSILPTGSMATARFRPAMVEITQGIIVAGGNDQSYVDNTGQVPLMEIYDYLAKFFATQPINFPQGSGTSQVGVVSLPGSQALIAGGTNSDVGPGAQYSTIVTY